MDKRNIKAIILAGNGDFGRCKLAEKVPRALWPVMGTPVLQHLLECLLYQGIKEAVICCENSAILKSSISGLDSMEIEFLSHKLPIGSAGCIRDAAKNDANKLLIVLNATTISPPDFDALIEQHYKDDNDLTVILNPAANKTLRSHHPTGIYICEPAILNHIRPNGYFDIKEGLIPALVENGKAVRALTLNENVNIFRNRAEYLTAVGNYLQKDFETTSNPWLIGDVKIHSTAQIYGAVAIMAGARISENAIIFGPTVIGENVSIGKNSLIENSVLWDGVRIGQNCQVNRCVVDHNAFIPDEITVKDKAVTKADTATEKVGSIALSLTGKIKNNKSILKVTAISILSIAFLWCCWPQIRNLWNLWQRSDEYSSGLLVPLLAVYILWVRRDKIKATTFEPSMWGLVGLIMAQALRYFGLFFMYSSAERLSVVLSIFSLVVLMLGWAMFRKLLPILLFLFLMLPLPRSVHTAVTLPLQNLATISAVFCLETLGYSVIREGNVININGNLVAVAEACNGLRMVTSFFVITAMVVLVVKRKLWEKVTVLFSALPVALLCNTIRLTLTAIAFTVLVGQNREEMFHDFGGYAMMPLALSIVVFELWFLGKLTYQDRNSECSSLNLKKISLSP